MTSFPPYLNSKSFPFCFSGHQYAQKVVSGEIPNCRYVIGACQRYFKDLENPKFYMDWDKAERYLRIVQRFDHVKGNWPTENIVYEPWQNFCFMNIMGFYSHETGERRFRVAHIEVPRGHGKSAMASQAVLFFLALDDPKGNEISCFATKAEQARIVLDSARAMARKSVSYREKTGVRVLTHRIIHEESNSFARAMSSDDKSMDGLNDILSVLDELHAMDRKLFDAVLSGMSKRRDSLALCITTAGFDHNSVGYTQSAYAKKVCLGETVDDTFFSVVYTIDEGDDIYAEATWKKANPSYGKSVDDVTFAAKASKAKITPSDVPNFKVKHLNIWLNEANPYYDLAKWDACYNPDLKLEDFKGKPCFVGLDIANKVDLASLTVVFYDRTKDKYSFFTTPYLPEATVSEARNVLYDQCRETGHLRVTAGEAINYDILKDDIVEVKKHAKIFDVHYDPWNATSFAQDLTKARIPMTEFRFNTSNLSEPTKELDALMRQGKIEHDGNPLVRWCVGNVVCKEDAGGNVFPRKSDDKLKIDCAVSMIMALAGWIQKNRETSVYSERGFRTF